MSNYEFIKVTESDRIARMTLARPPVNVLNIAMLSEINRYLEALIDRHDICALVIDGEGKHFCAGVDVPEHAKETVNDMIGTFHRTFRIMHKLPMPTVCAVHGGAYGGGLELAVFCDIVLAADDLKIGVPEITLGVFPPLAVAHLARMIGINRAAELIYTGAIIGGDEACRIGLINHLYPAAEFRDKVEAFVGQFKKLSAFALAQAKEAFRKATQADFESILQSAEKAYLEDLMAGNDPNEGLGAFMEKRKPVWQDR